jgi:RNA polymerase sigma-70 factor, ECF subfamily
MNDDLPVPIESVFRQESGKIIATLIQVSGSFDLAEEPTPDAFSAAIKSWPETGIPANPAALDNLRRTAQAGGLRAARTDSPK